MKKTAIDIWLIDEGKLGVINFNNMIPCPIEELTELLPTVKEEKYKKLYFSIFFVINFIYFILTSRKTLAFRPVI